DGKEDFFGCIVKIGSNFVELESPYERSFRVHFNEFDEKLRREMNPEAVLKNEIDRHRSVVREKLGLIKELTARLGLDASLKLEKVEESSSRALSVLQKTEDPKQYKK